MALKRTRAEEILGEWGVRDVTPPSAAERARLERDRDLNALHGQALPRRIRRFRPEADTYLASLGGPLPYMQRARAIDEEIEAETARLEAAYTEHAGDPERWRRLAARWDFGALNELIERHNRWYPIEARLPMDPRSRDFVKVGGRDYRRRPLDAGWILERFPAAELRRVASR
ncbi:MAG TPA: hypothetical protein VH063_07345 [Gaiellaceae bacterium]|nr:hypothetical protein [Gaiellaceae bacterium]